MFKLMNAPRSEQITIRIINLCQFYGTKDVLDLLYLLDEESGEEFNDPVRSFDKDSEHDMLYVQLIQMKQHWGNEAIKTHLETFYTIVAA